MIRQKSNQLFWSSFKSFSSQKHFQLLKCLFYVNNCYLFWLILRFGLSVRQNKHSETIFIYFFYNIQKNKENNQKLQSNSKIFQKWAAAKPTIKSKNTSCSTVLPVRTGRILYPPAWECDRGVRGSSLCRSRLKASQYEKEQPNT